jgi:outer membrane protein assembly factor BamA
VEAARRSVLALGYYTDVTVKTDETPEGVCLTFTVREKQRLREIHVLGNTVFTEEELLEQMVLQPGMIADSITIRGDTARIQAFYQKRGYDAFVVNARLEFGELTVAISERRIRRIEIKGLETTKSDVVTETLGIKEGDIFDQGRVVTGLRRMLQLPGIEEAVWDLRHDPTDPQRYVVLVVDVQEKGGRNGEQ